MALVNKRILDLPERAELSSDDYTVVDGSNGGTAKYKLSKMQENIDSVGQDVSGLSQTVAAHGTRLTTAEQNIGTNTEDIADLKEDLEQLVYDKSTSTAWEKGMWSVSDGSASAVDIYIRYNAGFVPDDVIKMEVASGYLFAVWAWSRSNNTYVGIYQKDGTFAKNGSNSKAVTVFDPTAYQNYKLKVAMLRNPSSASITPSEGENFYFYRLKEEDNGQLDKYSGLIYSGDTSVGDTLFDSTTVSAGDTLYYKTHLLEASSASGSAGYVALYDASDNRIACFGTLAIEQAKINEVRFGTIVVPEGFSYAKWAGNKAGTVEYISKYMPPEYFETYYGENKVDLLKNPAYADGWRYDPNTKTQVATNGIGLTSYIPVAPHGKITLTKHLHGKSYGHAFYDANLALVEQYASVQGANDSLAIDIPENAYYVRFTFLISTMADAHAYYEAPPIDKLLPEYILNPYVRRAIKEYGQYYLDKEFTHVMAASICYFAGMKVLAYRCGYMHDSRTDSSLYGYTQIDTIAPDGTLSHVAQYKASDFGCTGDARDPFMGVSKDGKYLLLLIPYNRGSASTPTNDCALVCLNQSLAVVDYLKVVSNVYRFTYGTPLITPTGHVIFNAYTGDNKQYVYRSNEVFSGTVSNLTFTDTLVLTTSDTSNEACMGYHNGKLYMLIRCDTVNGKIIWTDDLEGVSGWSSPVSIGSRIHAPRLLPNYNGEYIPFVASWFDQGSTGTRKPALGYINVNTENQTAEIVGIGMFDNTLDEASNNGYPAFLSLGGECYAVTYYQEDATYTYSGQHQQTGLYYKYINAREVIPSASYFLN